MPIINPETVGFVEFNTAAHNQLGYPDLEPTNNLKALITSIAEDWHQVLWE
jgi:hypothetical protein